MKLEANMEAVTLRQSKQLQTKVLTRPGASVGCILNGHISIYNFLFKTRVILLNLQRRFAQRRRGRLQWLRSQMTSRLEQHRKGENIENQRWKP